MCVIRSRADWHDILIYSSDLESHIIHVTQVLERLQRYKLLVKPEKCVFAVPSVHYLGYVLSEEGISMVSGKVAAILDWSSPDSVKEVQRFLGLANFYRRFIPNFSEIVLPITRLLRKDSGPFLWSPEAEHGFRDLKRLFCSAPILRHPDQNRQFIVETDASALAIGAVLLQTYDGVEHPVAYLSKTLSPSQLNYSVLEKELLAMKLACEDWRHLLMGARHPFLIRTDHKNLKALQNMECVNSRQARWAYFFAQYDFHITYLPGSSNKVADALSRKEVPGDYTPLSREAMFRRNKILGLVNVFFQEVKTALASERMKLSKLRGGKYTEKEGLVFYENRLYIPEGPWRKKIIHLGHDPLTSGHRGVQNTNELIARRFFWPELKGEVKDYIKACPICARAKYPSGKPLGLLTQPKMPTRPWGLISTDFIVDLPESESCTCIMVTIDTFTKLAHFSPLPGLPTAIKMAETFTRDVFRLHGLPDKIISDRGSQFISNFWKALCTRVGMERALSSGFRPQSNGQTE